MIARALPWIAVLIGIVLIVWTTTGYLQAKRNEQASRAALVSITHQITLLQELESKKPSSIFDGEPASGLSGQITDALAAAGLPPTTLASFQPDADQVADTHARITRRSARLTLSHLTLAQFGRFIAIWRSRRPEWLPIAMTLSPHSLDGKDTARQTQAIQAPLTVQLTIECRFLPKPPTKPATLIP